MNRRIAFLTAALAALALIGLAGAPRASAHERRTVAGTYTFVVGFMTEPALLEEPNGISLTVTNAQTNAPVEGLEKTLKADVMAGGQSKTVDLRARFGQKGAYTADLIPTRAGTWTFVFHGTIEGTQIHEQFESGPGRFNDVQPKSDLQFPVKQPTIAELAAQVEKGGGPAETAVQGGRPSPDVQRALDRADSARTTALIFGTAGTVLGALGLLTAAYALIARRRPAVRAGGSSEPV